MVEIQRSREVIEVDFLEAVEGGGEAGELWGIASLENASVGCVGRRAITGRIAPTTITE